MVKMEKRKEEEHKYLGLHGCIKKEVETDFQASGLVNWTYIDISQQVLNYFYLVVEWG